MQIECPKRPTPTEIGNVILNLPTPTREWLIKQPRGAEALAYIVNLYPKMAERKERIERLMNDHLTREYFRSIEFYCTIHSMSDNDFNASLRQLTTSL